MATWFECKVRYEKTMDNGKNKKVNELYLVDALNFTEAENRIIEEMKPFISGDFRIQTIKRTNYAETFECDAEEADKWFKCKVFFITINERTSKEKKTAHMMLVQASSIQDAIDRLEKNMKTTMSDYQTASVTETELMDVYPYSGHGTDDNTKKYKGEKQETTAGIETAKTKKKGEQPSGIGFAVIKARDEAPLRKYTPQEEKTLKAEAMATLPFTERTGGDQVEMQRMRSFINKSQEKKEEKPVLDMGNEGEPEPAYKAIVKAVINSGNYGIPIWTLKNVVRTKDDAIVMRYVKRMEDEGLAERFGQSVRKKVSVLPKRFL